MKSFPYTYLCFDTAPLADKVQLPLTDKQIERAKDAGFSIRKVKAINAPPMCEEEFTAWFDIE